MVPVPAGIEDGQTVRMPVGKKEARSYRNIFPFED